MIKTLKQKIRTWLPRTGGAIDSWDGGHCRGWAIDSKKPNGIARVEVVLDGNVVDAVNATLSRPDLLQAGYKSAHHGFSVKIPDAVYLNPGLVCEVRVANAEVSLKNSKFTFGKNDKLPPELINKISDEELGERYQHSKLQASSMITSAEGTVRDGNKLICLYAINSEKPAFYVKKTCEELIKIGYSIVLINSMESAPLYEAEYSQFSDMRIYKKDWGRDFASWLCGYFHLENKINTCDHVLFINDSVIGPLQPIQNIIDEYKKSNSDFWALTDSYDQVYHYQSSVFILSNTGLMSRGWKLFVSTYDFPNEKIAVIRDGELGLSQIMFSDGIRSSVMCPYEKLASTWWETVYDRNAGLLSPPIASINPVDPEYITRVQLWNDQVCNSILNRQPRNPQHTFWDTLLRDYKYPFIKKELYVFNPENVPNLTLSLKLLPEDQRDIASEILKEFTKSNLSTRLTPPLY